MLEDIGGIDAYGPESAWLQVFLLQLGMTFSTPARAASGARATRIWCTDDRLYVQLEDGREIAAPLIWFPRLAAASPEQRAHWVLIGRGVGVHWPDIDEDISVAGLLRT